MLKPRAQLARGSTPCGSTRQLRQSVLHIDDLVEPGLEKIVLSLLAAFIRPHRESPASLLTARESQRSREINYCKKTTEEDLPRSTCSLLQPWVMDSLFRRRIFAAMRRPHLFGTTTLFLRLRARLARQLSEIFGAGFHPNVRGHYGNNCDEPPYVCARILPTFRLSRAVPSGSHLFSRGLACSTFRDRAAARANRRLGTQFQRTRALGEVLPV
jgi:hypothetical protein